MEWSRKGKPGTLLKNEILKVFLNSRAVVLKPFMYQNHLKRRFLKPRFLGPNLRCSDLVGLEWAVKICISSKFR